MKTYIYHQHIIHIFNKKYKKNTLNKLQYNQPLIFESTRTFLLIFVNTKYERKLLNVFVLIICFVF